MNQQAIQISGPTRPELVRRGQYLEYFTIGYNSLEAYTMALTRIRKLRG